MRKDKFILRTSGFALYFLSFLMGVFLFVIFLAVRDIFQKGFYFGLILIVILLSWMEINFYRFITGQKIEISGDDIILQVGSPTRRFQFLPRFEKSIIKLNDVAGVTVARRKYFEEHAQEFKDEKLENLTEAYRNLHMMIGRGGVAIPLRLEYATRYTPLLFIEPKDNSHKGIAVTTKPFSKNGFRKLIKELERRNIPVLTEPALGL